MNRNEALQRDLCKRVNARFTPSPSYEKLGIAQNVKSDLLPINGLRHPMTPGVTGWFIWSGERIDPSDDFFFPLHVEHVNEWNVGIQKYLGLPPGWRFLFTPDYEDIWFDEGLLNV